MRILLVAAAGLVLSGCLQAPTGPEDDVGPAPQDVTNKIPGVGFGECVQHHTQFAATASDFRSFLPDGFTIRTVVGDVFELGIEFSACRAVVNGTGPVRLAVFLLPVVPPNNLTFHDHRALVPIEAYASTPEAVKALRAVGIRPVEPCTCVHNTVSLGPAIGDEIVIQAANGTYTLRPLLRGYDGAFGQGKNALYVVQARQLAGIVVQTNSASQNRGLGPTSLSYQGSGAAPPIHAGFAHSVAGLQMTLTPARTPAADASRA